MATDPMILATWKTIWLDYQEMLLADKSRNGLTTMLLRWQLAPRTGRTP